MALGKNVGWVAAAVKRSVNLRDTLAGMMTPSRHELEVTWLYQAKAIR
jgi:hypothetical protein